MYIRNMKVDGSSTTYFLNRTPIFDWYLFCQKSKSKHHKDTCLKRDCTTFSNINNYSTLNSEHDWEDLSIQLKKINKHALPIN